MHTDEPKTCTQEAVARYFWKDEASSAAHLPLFFEGSRGTISLIAVISVAAGLTEAALLTLIATIAMSIAENNQSVAVNTLNRPGIGREATA